MTGGGPLRGGSPDPPRKGLTGVILILAAQGIKQRTANRGVAPGFSGTDNPPWCRMLSAGGTADNSPRREPWVGILENLPCILSCLSTDVRYCVCVALSNKLNSWS